MKIVENLASILFLFSFIGFLIGLLFLPLKIFKKNK